MRTTSGKYEQSWSFLQVCSYISDAIPIGKPRFSCSENNIGLVLFWLDFFISIEYRSISYICTWDQTIYLFLLWIFRKKFPFLVVLVENSRHAVLRPSNFCHQTWHFYALVFVNRTFLKWIFHFVSK